MLPVPSGAAIYPGKLPEFMAAAAAAKLCGGGGTYPGLVGAL